MQAASTRQLQVLPYQREDLGGIVGIGEAEGHPSLFAKRFAGRPFFMVGERGIGYYAALRDADPCLATGLPANLQHELRGSTKERNWLLRYAP